MKVHRQDPVGPRGFEEVGHEAGGDRNARPVFPVLAGIGVVRNNGRDAFRGGPLEGVDHEEQFHQMGVGGITAALDDEDILAAHVLVDVEMDFAVAEPFQNALAQLDP